MNEEEKIKYERKLADIIVSHYPKEWKENPIGYLDHDRIQFPGTYIFSPNSLDPTKANRRHNPNQLSDPGAFVTLYEGERAYKKQIALGFLPFYDKVFGIGTMDEIHDFSARQLLFYHELIHVTLNVFPSSIPEEFHTLRNFLDNTALRAILPDIVLEYLYSDKFEPWLKKESIPWFFKGSFLYYASPQQLALRIEQAKREGIITQSNIDIVLFIECRMGGGPYLKYASVPEPYNVEFPIERPLVDSAIFHNDEYEFPLGKFWLENLREQIKKGFFGVGAETLGEYRDIIESCRDKNDSKNNPDNYLHLKLRKSIEDKIVLLNEETGKRECLDVRFDMIKLPSVISWRGEDYFVIGKMLN